MEHHEIQLDGIISSTGGTVINTELRSRSGVSCVETDWQAEKVTVVIPGAATEADPGTLGYEVVDQPLPKNDEVGR